MKLLLQRQTYTVNSTQGELTEIDLDGLVGVHRAWTLERPDAVHNPTAEFHCIPAGTYQIQLYPSPHFQRVMPLLMNIPGHDGIEIHWGNYPLDSKGCILVGTTKSVDVLGSTRAKFDELFPLIEAATKTPEGCWITVQDG